MFVTDSKVIALAGDLPVRSMDVYVETDGGAHYDVMGIVPGRVNAWFVRSRRTLVWGMATVTSRVLWRETVRVRFDMARDTGDMAGTLSFDGDTFGGKGWTGALSTAGLAR